MIVNNPRFQEGKGFVGTDPTTAIAQENLAAKVVPLHPHTEAGVESLREQWSEPVARTPLTRALNSVEGSLRLSVTGLRDLANTTAYVLATGTGDQRDAARHTFALVTGVHRTEVDTLLAPVVRAHEQRLYQAV